MKKTQLFSTIFLLLISSFAFSGSYKLGSGDQIAITVYDEPDLTTKVKIDKSGVITFPFIGDLHVIGLTTKLLEKRIYDGLLGDYLIDPQVTVSVVSYRPFFIHGQVKRPGGYPFQDDLTLDKAIALAGGLASRASNSDWKITRIVDGTTMTINATVATLIQPDDIIKIEQSFF
ncbi:polysaccharide biosynthesis/export family protein [Thalassotalea piscium]|uniref:Polysaccharide export outer membrane protein n=1 Tax=Thalassotalea piscium TaxID=1230533 RepID=A0A7X0NGA1_9GAMM|nr:polysaccharide biosynthesis/export family protein [Thalassotalea piscium]MBB6542917.1 polysaccharide export outer membrane protein [Thalassotalea piscium]